MFELFFALFEIFDEDKSNTIEVDEFVNILTSLGAQSVDRKATLRLMMEHDRDGSGTIDGSEFAMIMVNEYCRIDLPRGNVVEKSTGLPWKIPTFGKVILDLNFETDSPSVFDVGHDDGVQSLLNGIAGAKTEEQRETLFEQATNSPYFFLNAEQSQWLFEKALKVGLSKTPLDIIASILPQVVNEEHVNRFLDATLNDLGKLALRVKLGQLYCAYTGLGTGHYVLDFSSEHHYKGAKRLSCIAVSEAKLCHVVGVDTSQRGNGTNFRNEKYDDAFVTLDGHWFAGAPMSGILHCDYVSTKRPLSGTLPVSNGRLRKIIQMLGLRRLLPEKERLDEEDAAYQAAMAEHAHKTQAASRRNVLLASPTSSPTRPPPAVEIEPPLTVCLGDVIIIFIHLLLPIESNLSP